MFDDYLKLPEWVFLCYTLVIFVSGYIAGMCD